MRHYLFILVLPFFVLPALAYAALININTADAVLLDSLPGIGPSKAAAIIDYRTQHGAFATIDAIQKVSGIGPSTYANISSLITVGDASSSNASSSAIIATTTQEQDSTAAPGGASTYTPPPSDISVTVTGNQAAMTEVPLQLSARVVTKAGAIDTNAIIVWSLGDGSSATGRIIDKVYHYAGTYLVTAQASDGDAQATSELTVTVKPVKTRIASISSEGITIANDSTGRLDLSGWRVTAGGESFRIPTGTVLLPGASVLFPSAITGLPVVPDPALAYPSGSIAMRYTPPTLDVATATLADMPIEQPVVSTTSYQRMKKVEPITSTKDVQSHAEAALAPAAPAEPVAAGAAVAAAPASSSGILHSPWTLGMLGTVLLAAGAFVFL